MKEQFYNLLFFKDTGGEPAAYMYGFMGWAIAAEIVLLIVHYVK